VRIGGLGIELDEPILRKVSRFLPHRVAVFTSSYRAGFVTQSVLGDLAASIRLNYVELALPEFVAPY